MALSSNTKPVAVALVLVVAAASPALASPSLFPASRTIIPVLVAGAFVLPALIALLFGRLSRLGRIAGPIAGVSVIAGLAAAAFGLAQYGPYSLVGG